MVSELVLRFINSEKGKGNNKTAFNKTVIMFESIAYCGAFFRKNKLLILAFNNLDPIP